MVVGEALGGSEAEFAKLMTLKARALGMANTTYVNASGLPDDEQITTARDQAILGRAIHDRFPRYYSYFSVVNYRYHGKDLHNHNSLLGNLEGVDGIKTGYTRASGFNLVTSMHRGNRHLVGVVMGGRSGGSRDAIMRSLLAEKISSAPRPSVLSPRSSNAILPMPMLRKPRPQRSPRNGLQASRTAWKRWFRACRARAAQRVALFGPTAGHHVGNCRWAAAVPQPQVLSPRRVLPTA